MDGRARRSRPPGSSAASVSVRTVICPLTGKEHRLFWLRSAWWCHDCHQKVETCCEGGGCPSVVEAAPESIEPAFRAPEPAP